jgi:cytochrome P450
MQMIQWIIYPMTFMEACAQRYGDLFTVRLGVNLPPYVFASNPQTLQEILTGDSKQYDAPGEVNQIVKPIVGQYSMFLLSGARHQRERQLLMPPFHGERMRTYGDLIGDITEQVSSQWQIGQPFCLRDSMQVITLRVMLRAVFGLHEGTRYQQLEHLLGAILHELSFPLSAAMLFFPALQRDLGSLTPWGKFLRRQRQIDALIYEEIQERRAQLDPSRTDILSLLMAARDEAGEPMTDVELHDELMTLLVAGHETTATALAWALYWIHKLPSVHERLLQELDSLNDLSDTGGIFRLPYLNAVCSETLRIYPVGMLTFPRVTQEPVTLMGYDLAPGTLLVGSIYLLHQREDLYPEPKQFRPERFLERQFSPYEYLPFGGGSRRCIGLAFAQFEMKVVLARILSHLHLSLAENRPVRPVRRGLVTGPAGGVQMVMLGRRSPQTASPELTTSSV